MNDNDVVGDLAVVIDMFNAYALLLIVLGGGLIWGVNWGIRRLSQKLMEQLPTRRFLILQISTLISFTLYLAGTIPPVVGVERASRAVARQGRYTAQHVRILQEVRIQRVVEFPRRSLNGYIDIVGQTDS